MDNTYNRKEVSSTAHTPAISTILSLQEKLLANRNEIIKRSCQDITFSKPLLSLGDQGVIFPNTINVIQGKKGVHKSRLTETFSACFLDKKHGDYLGFKRDLNKSMVVLYVDTERNQKDQFPFALQKIKLRAGYDKEDNPDNFDCISLINIPRKNRFEVLDLYIETIRTKYQDHHFLIVLDVVTDCVENFNDANESMKLIDMMNELINQQNVTFLVVIHENPGGEKARGHLGTEIINKASQVMQIGYESDKKDLIVVKFLHSRNTRPLDPIFLMYDDATRGLILADPAFIVLANENRQEKAPISDVKLWMEENLMGKQGRGPLMDKLLADFGCGPRTMIERLKALVDEGFLSKTKEGNNVFYELNPGF